MKTTGTVTLADMKPGILASALTPAASTIALRSAAGIALAAMAESDDSIALAIKADGSRLIKFNGGTLSPLFSAMITGGAVPITYGEVTDTTKSRVLRVLGGEVSTMPAVIGEGGPAVLSGLTGRIVRALAGFDPVEASDATPSPVAKTPLAILNALAGVPGVEYVLMDQTDNGQLAPRVIVVPANVLGAEIFLQVGANQFPLIDYLDGSLDTDLNSEVSDISTLFGAELVEIDLPEVNPTTPAGPRLAFE